MPAVYQVADRSASLTAAGRLGEFRTTATDRAFIREISVSVGVAGASPTIGIIRPNAIGVTPTTPKTAQAIDPANPAATLTTATAWGTAPTLPGTPVYLERVTLPATLGAGWVWQWAPGEELIIPISSSLLVDLIALSAATATAIDWRVKYVE
jgi:hypothetical protein